MASRAPALFRISKSGGEPQPIALGWVDNVFVDATGLHWTRFISLKAKHEVFRQLPNGTKLSLGLNDETWYQATQIHPGPFERAVTDGVHWVFSTSIDDAHEIFGASYPDGQLSLIYQSPTATPPRAVALTPTRLALGVAHWERRHSKPLSRRARTLTQSNLAHCVGGRPSFAPVGQSQKTSERGEHQRPSQQWERFWGAHSPRGGFQ